MSPDTISVWVATGVAAAAFLGVATSFPTVPPPDATGVANTVDRVAAAEHPTTATHEVAADAVWIGERRIALRNDAGTASAAFAYGPVVPVAAGTRLADVLRGTPPATTFDGDTAFRRAIDRARNRTVGWTSADRVRVRRVSWEGIDVTLVGA